MERSKYISYKRTKAPRNKRAKVVPGSFEDRNKYYRCVNCGFIFDIETTSMGGEQNGNYSVPASSPVYNDSVINIETPFDIGGVCRIDSTGNIIEPVVMGQHKVSSGCPLCGSTNQFGG